MGKIETVSNIMWSLLAICIAYGLIAVYIPLKLLSINFQAAAVDIGSIRYSGLMFILTGTVINLKCYWDLIFTGKGTMDPLMPTEKLVISGFYQFIRNPVYVGIILILLGETLFFSSTVLLGYSLLWLLALNLIVVFIEEPSLKQKFGKPYDEYLKSTPRWIPRQFRRHD